MSSADCWLPDVCTAVGTVAAIDAEKGDFTQFRKRESGEQRFEHLTADRVDVDQVQRLGAAHEQHAQGRDAAGGGLIVVVVGLLKPLQTNVSTKQ